MVIKRNKIETKNDSYKSTKNQIQTKRKRKS